MERDSFIFYRSFYEAARELNQKDRMKFYDALFDLALNGKETEMKGPAKAVLISVIPQIVANNIRYRNGSKGGAPKNNQNAKKKQPKNNLKTTETEPNENEECRMKMKNENEECRMKNENDNENVIGLYELELGRPLSSFEMGMILELENVYGKDLITLALKEAVRNGKRAINYIEGILRNWKAQGIKSVMDVENLMNARRGISQTFEQEDTVSAEEREKLLAEMESWNNGI